MTTIVKLLVFAHTPPPHHGQSFMVQLLLDVLARDSQTPNPASRATPRSSDKIECYHVNCRFSDGIEDIGRIRAGKLVLAIKYCLEAIWYRWRFGADTFFYIPAPPLRSAIYRDWLVMLLCRPFFRKRIFYWQAAGLGEWLKSGASAWERLVCQWLLGRPDLSIVLGDYCRADAAAIRSRRTEVVPNGIPDPCPEFDRELLLRRRVRSSQRLAQLGSANAPATAPADSSGLNRFKVLFMSLCTREKGLFDAIESVVIVNRRLAQRRSPLRVQLEVAGKFWREPERVEFERRIGQPDLNGDPANAFDPVVRYHGFVGGADKFKLLTECDCFCFPSYYQAESFGIVIVEAMAFGLPVVTTRWRTIPELLPSGYPGVVDPRSPAALAAALEAFLTRDYDPMLRARFLERYSELQFAESMKAAIRSMPG